MRTANLISSRSCAMACAVLMLSSALHAQPQTADAKPLTPTERRHVLDLVVEDVRRYYFDPAIAKKTAQALRTHQAHGEYAGKNGPEFAALLTKHLREASHDMQLVVDYFHDSLPVRRPEPSPDDLARRRRELERLNCTIAKPEILPGNIGYLRFDFFPELSTCSERFGEALRALDSAGAIIFDLRENRGGMPDTVSFVAAHLFDHPEYLFNPRETPSEKSWTHSPVPGSHLAHKRVYVLTSSATFSGAEEFCYNMKMLRRVTLIGETTGGAAHAGIFHRIDPHFGMGIPEIKTLNPYGSEGWEGTGVEPDVKVNAADALETAKKMAASEEQR